MAKMNLFILERIPEGESEDQFAQSVGDQPESSIKLD